MNGQFFSFFVFILVSTSIFALAFWYLKRRLVGLTRLTAEHQKYLDVALFFFIFVPLVAIPMRFVGGWLSDVFSWVAYVSMGFFSYVFILTLLRDGTYSSITLFKKIRGDEDAISRRELFSRGFGKTIIGVSAATAGYGLYEARKYAQIVEQTVTLKSLPEAFDGFRIAQISDIHVGLTIKKGFIEGIAEQVNELKADLVAITGDLVDGTVEHLHDHVLPLASIKSKHGSFFCTGNHEYYSGAEEWGGALEKMGIRVLLNENQVIEKKGQKLYIAGVTDYRAERYLSAHKTSVRKALLNTKVDDCVILLAHNPYSITEAGQNKVDLQLSGHTHGGQFFPWNLFVYLVYPYVKGLHKHDDTFIYVNRGTGYWGPPVRIGVPSEITLLTLKRA